MIALDPKGRPGEQDHLHLYKIGRRARQSSPRTKLSGFGYLVTLPGGDRQTPMDVLIDDNHRPADDVIS